MLTMRTSHDPKRYSSHLRNELPTTSSQYRHKTEDNRLAFSPIHVQGTLYIHANTNQMKAMPPPLMHKVDPEPYSVYITLLVTKILKGCLSIAYY